jgi:hypothetical protein
MSVTGPVRPYLIYSDRSESSGEGTEPTATADSPVGVELQRSGPGRPSTLVPILRLPGYTLRQPLYAVIQETSEGVVGTIHDLDLFEYGAEEADVIASLRQAVAELIQVLLREGEELSAELDDQRRFLSSILGDS